MLQNLSIKSPSIMCMYDGFFFGIHYTSIAMGEEYP
jgi:hypothetical protein